MTAIVRWGGGGGGGGGSHGLVDKMFYSINSTEIPPTPQIVGNLFTTILMSSFGRYTINHWSKAVLE